MPRWLANLLTLLLVVGIPPFLVLSNVFLFMTPQYLSFEYERGNRNFEQFKGLGVYNDRELNHMVDVRVLVAQVSVFQAMDGLLLLVLLITLASIPDTHALAPRGLLAGGIITIALFGVIGVFAASAFSAFFTDFHRVFFQGDTWLF